MDASLRQKIMNEIVSSPVIKEEVSTVKESNEGKIYQYRKMLSQIKEYCRILKLDEEDWDDTNWKSFEQWLQKKESKTENIIESVFQRKALREKQEQDEKDSIRKKIFQSIEVKF